MSLQDLYEFHNSNQQRSAAKLKCIPLTNCIWPSAMLGLGRGSGEDDLWVGMCGWDPGRNLKPIPQLIQLNFAILCKSPASFL